MVQLRNKKEAEAELISPLRKNENKTTPSLVGETARNSLLGMAFFLLTLLAQFFYRRYFIQVLGDELLGLNGTLSSIINFLNIAELGLGSAIGFTLYKPLVQKDHKSVCEIVSLQGWFYRIVALFIFSVGTILLFFFPLLLGNLLSTNHIPHWYAYATFSVLLVGSLLGYLFNYRQILLFSDLKGYKVTLVIKGIAIIKMLLQILFFLLFRSNPLEAYLFWLGIEFLSMIFQTIGLEIVIRKSYPWLKTNKNRGARLRLKYPVILKKTGQLFFHKIATFVVLMSIPLIIASVLESQNALYMVAVYQNYYILFTAANGVISAIYSAFTPTIGKLKASNRDSFQMEKIFRSTLILRIFISLIFSFFLLLFSKDLMTFWVGGERCFSSFETLLFALYCYLQLARNTETFTEAYGMFQDVWAPIVEAILLLGLSLIFGKLWGLQGIFWGMIVSALLIVHLWKPIFLYRWGFKLSSWIYFRAMSSLFLLMSLIGFALKWIKDSYFFSSISLDSFVLLFVGWLFLYCLLSFSFSYLLLPDFRQAVSFFGKKLRRR